MGWEIVLFILALAFAFKLAAKGVANAFVNRRRAKAERRDHRSQLVTEAINDGVAPRQAKAAADAAARAAVTVSSWSATWIALKNGWLDGWREGRKRGAELRDGTEPPVDIDETVAYPPFTADSSRADHEKNNECTVVVGDVRDGDRFLPRLCGTPLEEGVCPIHQPPTMPDHAARVEPMKHEPEQPEPEKEQKTMPIESRTGGEVLTKEQYKNEIEAMIREMTAELEDAQANLQRAQEDVQRVEVMSASLASAEIDRSTVEATRALADTNADQIRLARDRITAAEIRKAQAEKCLATLDTSAQNNFYAA
jgi:hypothetical protein